MAKKRAKGKKETAFEKFAQRPPELTVLTDHPLAAEEAGADFETDPFNFRYKLGPVYDIVRYKAPGGKDDHDSGTPLAVLISGGWGTGKTSAMRWLEGLLAQWNQKAGANQVKVHPVWFYPWKYDSKEDVWRGLVSEVIIASIKVENVTWQRAKNAAKQFGLFLGKGFLHALASVKFKGKVSAGVVGAEAEADLTCLKDILSEYQEAAHPEKAYLNEFEDSLEKWVTGTLGDNERIIVFIDDLDRCMPDIALQVLEALKLYLNIPKLIFVVGVDRNVIERLVVEHYTKLGLVRRIEQNTFATEQERERREREDAERKKDEAKARQYLSKMFQVEVELAPSEEQVRGFFEERLEDIPYWKENLRDEAHRDLFRNVVLELAGRNPREVKRLLNSALMAGAGTSMLGVEDVQFEQGLQDYFVRTIIQKRYPSLADMIATDVGRQFFVDWSRLRAEFGGDTEETKQTATSPSKQKGATARHVVRHEDTETQSFPEGPETRREDRVTEELAKNPQYKDYLRLTTDRLLASLMTIPFSAALAERTRQSTIPPVPTVSATTRRRIPPVPRVSALEPETREISFSKNETIIREAMARALDKSPSDLTADDRLEITELDLSLSQVNDLQLLKELTNLRKLELGGTPASDLTPLKSLRSIEWLVLQGTQVNNLEPLRTLTTLRKLYLNNTQVNDLEPLSALTRMRRLYLNGTPIDNVEPLDTLIDLETLDISNTAVADIRPLRKLNGLTRLDLRSTQVARIDSLSELTNLRELYIGNTQVNDVISLRKLITLQWLDVRETPVNKTQLDMLQQALPDLTILRQ